VGSMTVSVPWRKEFDGVVNGGATCLVTFGEEARTNQLPVTVIGRKSYTCLATPFPACRNGAEVGITEARALRPDSGVEDSDDDVGSVVRLGPESALISEANELRRARGVKVAAAVLEDSEDGGVVGERRDLLVAEQCGEAVENGVVEVDNASWVDELGGVPVVVCGENGGFGMGIDSEDECFGRLIVCSYLRK